MINIIDNFLNDKFYEYLWAELKDKSFDEVDTGDKSFWAEGSSEDFNDLINMQVAELEEQPINHIYSFFRKATDEVDTDWRIHSDSIMFGQQPERALVLYLSPSTFKGLHGTAFWTHNTYGDALPTESSAAEYDRMLAEESNQLENWELSSVVGYKPNRALFYPSNYFHSKYPNTGWKEGRIVYVMFYNYEV